MMLHPLHYDVACYSPRNKWHPGEVKESFLFTALTPRGLEQLSKAPLGNFKDGRLTVEGEAEATDVMDYIDILEVYVCH